MKVKLLQGRAGTLGPARSWSEDPGTVVDVPDDEARRLIASDAAEPVKAGVAGGKTVRTATNEGRRTRQTRSTKNSGTRKRKK